MKRNLYEAEMTCIIKDLLCLSHCGEYSFKTCSNKIKFKFKGNIYNVQREILRWLSLRERIENMNILGD